MANKIICCSFDKDSMGGFMTISNGVRCDKPEHYSKTISVTKEAFIAACKDKILFNDILGVDIRQGWQNQLSAAIEAFKDMKEEFDPAMALKVSSEIDVKMRGEDAVNEDIVKLEKHNEELEKELLKLAKKPKKKAVKTKEKKNDDRPTETVDNSVADTGSQSDAGLPADGAGADSAN